MKPSTAFKFDRKSLGFLSSFLLALFGCTAEKRESPTPEPKISGETVNMVTNSPQCAALTVEPVAAEQRAFIPLTGRLVWDDDVTVRVFTPFAGIVRKLLVDINQPVIKGA